MFTVIWAFAVAATLRTGMIGENTPYPDEATCQAAVEAHKERAVDVIRGSLQEGWETEIMVRGACIVRGEPARG